jgi:hypothetical protein
MVDELIRRNGVELCSDLLPAGVDAPSGCFGEQGLDDEELSNFASEAS